MANNRIHRWLTFLNEIFKREEGIKMATNILLQVSKEEEARAYYESELLFELDHNSRMDHARQEGIIEGIIEGEARGEAKGEKKVAKMIEAMKKSGMTEEAIANIVKLTEND